MRTSTAEIAALIVATCMMARGVDAASAGGLSFEDALAIAERSAPSLAAEDEAIAAARATVLPAGALPDPRLLVGIDNFAVSGPPALTLDEEPMTMGRIGLMQEFPNSAKRRARTEMAEAAVENAEAARAIERLRVRRETALAWIARHYLELQHTFIAELDRENRLFADTVTAQIAAGRATAPDTVLPRQEAAMLADRRDELTLAIARANASLRRWVGAAADGPLAGDPPSFPIDHGHLRHRLERHPELAVYASLGDLAEARVREATAAKRPDWALELAYGRRDSRFGDMVSMQLSVDLPLFATTRQEPLILARQAEVNRIADLREAMLREHAEELEQQVAEHERSERALARQRQVLVPLARDKVALGMAAYTAGSGPLDAVLAARRELIEARLRVIALESEVAQWAARLVYAYGADAR